MKTLIQYGVNIGSSGNQRSDRFNIVVMGSRKTGKTKFIFSLLQLQEDNGGLHDDDCRIENIFEYKEHTDNQIIPGLSSAPASRADAINTGNIFVLMFSVNDLESFIFADELRRDIIEKKGKDIPIIFVGLKSVHKQCNAFAGSYGLSLFADVVFDFPESYYFELSFPDEDVLRNIYNELILLRKNCQASTKSRQAYFGAMATNYLRKLVPNRNSTSSKTSFLSC